MIRRFHLSPLHLYGLLSLLVFLAVQSLRLFSVAAPNWIFNYLNDFLVIPMVAIFALQCVWWIKKDHTIRLDIFTILSLVIFFSFVFEYYLPQQSIRYTADNLDVFCYVMGGVVFYFLQKIN